ncbi:hypothetical protein Lal_00022299, partial [Lupinus albus]
MESQGAKCKKFIIYIIFKMNYSITLLIDNFKSWVIILQKFSSMEPLTLHSLLENYLTDICSDSTFLELGAITNISIKLVKT